MHSFLTKLVLRKKKLVHDMMHISVKKRPGSTFRIVCAKLISVLHQEK